jgi:hypothetical protein
LECHSTFEGPAVLEGLTKALKGIEADESRAQHVEGFMDVEPMHIVDLQASELTESRSQ